MKKAELRKLPRLAVTNKIKSLARTKVKGKNWYGKPYKGLYQYYLRMSDCNGIIKISLFDEAWIREGNTESKYDVFIDTDEAKYITLEKDKSGKELKWRGATIAYIAYEYDSRYRYKDFTWSNIDTFKKLKKLLKNDGNTAFDIISEYQNNILSERIRIKEEAECKKWNDDMKPIRKLPSGFDGWIRKNAIQDHFIFYNYSKNIRTGFCSCCGKPVKIADLNPRHNKRSRCPVCRSPILFKSSGKISTLSSDSFEVQLVQPYKTGYVIRGFQGRMFYKNSRYTEPIIQTYEYRRCIYCGNERKMYTYSMYKNKHMQWMEANEKDYMDMDGTIYPKGLERLSQYDLFKKAFKNKNNISLQKWERSVIRGSIYEKLIKADFSKLFSQLFSSGYYFDEELLLTEETELHKMLRLDKMRMKRLKAMNGGIKELVWFQDEKKANTIWPDEMIRLFSDAGYDEYLFRFISDKMTFPQIFEYLKKQYLLHGYTWDYTISCWRDYMNMAAKLNIPLDLERNYKPKDVRLAHNEALDILRGKDIANEAVKIDKKWRKLKKLYPKLKKYEYSDRKYKVIAPESTADIVREGMILKHCVHSSDYYFQRMSTDESYILFLRKADSPTIPYYTLEVEPGGNIRQKRTTGDRQNKDFEDAKQFLAKWQRAIQNRITKKDKENGKKSNALRIQELAELRKKQSRVWHGVLQGQLLADVLEADFMPVICEKEELPEKAV